MDKDQNVIIKPDETKLEKQFEKDDKDMNTDIYHEVEGKSILNRSSMMTYSKIICCLCGATIDANPRAICKACDQKNIDITDGVPRYFTIDYCKLCDRYNRPPWSRCQLESPDMMTLCLSRVKNSTKAKIVDSSFIWTEPHSKQIKVKLSIQKEIDNALVTTSFIIEYKVNWMQCDDCKKSFTPHKWKASVQIRQKVKSKMTFLYLEQLVLKHKMHLNTLNIKELPEGVDFYFSNKNFAFQFTDFICGMVPCKVKQTKQIISENERDYTQSSKLTFMIQIAPICKDELIILTDKQSKLFGAIGPIVLCNKFSSKISLIDPLTFKTAEIDSHTYWKYEFKSYIDRSCLKEFLVMNCEEEIEYKKYSHHHHQDQNTNQDQQEQQLESENPNISSSSQSHNISKSTNYCLNASQSQSLIIETNERHIKIVKCIRNFPSDNTDLIEVKTHIGNKIQPGDIILGYDLNYINLGEKVQELIQGKENSIPDVILVKKKAANDFNNKKPKLKHLDIEKEIEMKKGKKRQNEDNEDKDYEEFLNDIQDDKEMLNNIDFKDDDDNEKINKNNDNKDQTKEKLKQKNEDDDNNDVLIVPQKISETNKKETKGEKKPKGKKNKKKKEKKQNQLKEENNNDNNQ